MKKWTPWLLAVSLVAALAGAAIYTKGSTQTIDGAFTNTTGLRQGEVISQTYNPASGDAVYAGLEVRPTIAPGAVSSGDATGHAVTGLAVAMISDGGIFVNGGGRVWTIETGYTGQDLSTGFVPTFGVAPNGAGYALDTWAAPAHTNGANQTNNSSFTMWGSERSGSGFVFTIGAEAVTAPGDNACELTSRNTGGGLLTDDHTRLFAISNATVEKVGWSRNGYMVALERGINNWPLVTLTSPVVSADGTIGVSVVPAPWIDVGTQMTADYLTDGTDGAQDHMTIDITDGVTNCDANLLCTSGGAGAAGLVISGSCIFAVGAVLTISVANSADCAVAPTLRSLTPFYDQVLDPT
jgi:hypothetical protein